MSDVMKINTAKSAADRLVVKIGMSRGHRGKVKNVAMAWPDLVAKLMVPAVDNITRRQYDKLPVMEQVKRKNQGYFVGGQFDDGVRRIPNIHKRSMLTLDCDRMDKEQFSELTDPLIGYLAEFEYFAYTTRSHRHNSPRLRVVVPLMTEVDVDAFQAASRILAHKLDARMELVDPVSHRPAQVMYYPSRCSDDEFVPYRHRGRLLDAQTDLLEPFGDWQNWHSLPRGERDAARPTGGKAEHPSQKRGLIGAYCRARDVFAQLFSMPDLYEPTEAGPTPTRWSYKLGHSRDGVILYPEDGRMQSHHSTDPCADQNLITFDIERIHRFGHLDNREGNDEFGDTPPTELASYKALIAAIQDKDQYADVRHEHVAMQYDLDAQADDAEFQDDLEDDEPTATHAPGAIVDEARAQPPAPTRKASASAEVTSKTDKAEKQEDWRDKLDMTEKGSVRKSYHNLETILKHDSRFTGAFRYNEFLRKPVLVRAVGSKSLGTKTRKISNKGNGDNIDDTVRSVARAILSAPNRDGGAGWGVEYSMADITTAVDSIAKDAPFHPVKKYLQAVKWDGVNRVHTMWQTYWHCREDAHYLAELAEKVMTACVARVFEPGIKFDYMVILEGYTGSGKSTSVRKLAPQPEWFGVMLADLSKPERVIESFKNRWLIEMAELKSMTRAESEAAKAIITAGTMTGRLAYRRDEDDFPFQFVFFGTTNDREYLKDPTGNRRYMPVRIPDSVPIDLAGIERDRDQLWAEALQYYLWYRNVTKHGELPLFVDEKADRVARKLQDERMMQSQERLWRGYIEDWLDTPTTEAVANGDWSDAADDLDGNTDNAKSLPHRMCVPSIAHYVLHIPKGQITRDQARAIANALDAIPSLKRGKQARFRKFGPLQAWLRDDL